MTPLRAGVKLRRLGSGIISPLALPRVILTYPQPSLIAQLMPTFKQGPHIRLPVAYGNYARLRTAGRRQLTGDLQALGPVRSEPDFERRMNSYLNAILVKSERSDAVRFSVTAFGRCNFFTGDFRINRSVEWRLKPGRRQMTRSRIPQRMHKEIFRLHCECGWPMRRIAEVADASAGRVHNALTQTKRAVLRWFHRFHRNPTRLL